MASVRENLRRFWLANLYAWKDALAYRLDFIFLIVDYFVFPVVNFAVITIIYTVSSGIAGWDYYQAVFLIGLIGLVRNIIRYAVYPNGLVRAMQQGTIDGMLTRPYSYLVMVISNFGSKTCIGAILSSMGIMLFALPHIDFTLASGLAFLAMVAVGTAALVLFFLLLILVSYKYFSGGSWVNWLLNTILNANEYPLSIYGVVGTMLFTFVLPVSLAVYFPAEVLLGFAGLQYMVGAVALASVMALAFYRAFYRMFMSYASGGG